MVDSNVCWSNFELELRHYLNTDLDLKHRIQTATREEKFRICINHPQIGGRIVEWLNSNASEVQAASKKSVETLKLKFSLAVKSKKSYEERLSNFNAAICHTLRNTGAWTNIVTRRKDLHYDNNSYKACLADIDVLLGVEKSEKVLFDLLEQKKTILTALCGEDKVTEALGQHDFSRETFNTNKDILVSLFNDLSESYKLRNRPAVFEDSDNKLPGTSSKLKITKISGAGDGVTACARINPLEHIITETAITSIILPEYLTKACQFCLKELSSPIGCENCNEVVFCDKECMDRCKQYHEYECGRLNLLSTTGVGQLALRTFMMSQFYPEIFAVRRMDKLIIHEENAESVELLLTSTFMILYLSTQTSFFKLVCKMDKIQACCLFLTYALKIISNASSVPAMKRFDSDVFHTLRQKIMGVALFPSFSKMNHACEPNIVASYTGNTVVIRALNEVEEGGELFNCYVDARYKDYATRTEELDSVHHFTCHCAVCINPEHPLHDISSHMYHFKCVHCQSLFILGPDEENNQSECRYCGKHVPYNYFVVRAFVCETLFNAARKCEKAGQYDMTRRLLNETLKKYDEFMYVSNTSRFLRFFDILGIYRVNRGHTMMMWNMLEIGRELILTQFGKYSMQYMSYLEYVFILYLETCKKSEIVRNRGEGEFGRELTMDALELLEVFCPYESPVRSEFERLVGRVILEIEDPEKDSQ